MGRRNKKPKCHWCDRQMNHVLNDGLQITRDHIRAKSNGGVKTVLACRACNELKANLHLVSWLWITKNVPCWWKLHREQSLRGVPLYRHLKLTVQ